MNLINNYDKELLHVLEVLHRYKLVLIALLLMLAALLIYMLLSNQGAAKIPSRGVFVLAGNLN
jgi:hypothetical protein